MQSQRSPVEAVVPSQAGHPGPAEQLAGELPAAPAGDGGVGGDAGAGSGAAALGHTGGHVWLCVYEFVPAYGYALVSVHQIPDSLTVKQYHQHDHS